MQQIKLDFLIIIKIYFNLFEFQSPARIGITISDICALWSLCINIFFQIIVKKRNIIDIYKKTTILNRFQCKIH